MVRRGAPALYELMRKPSGAAAGQPKPVAPRPAARPGSGPSIPDSFEISLGKLILLGVAVVVAISLAYGIGLSRGRSSGPAASDPAAAVAPADRSRASAAPGPAVPPLRGDGSSSASRPEGQALASNNPGDPRVKGWWYFVVAHPSTQRATEMVEFCRKNDLEAHRVPDDNALLRKIIVLPGYLDPSEKSSPQIKALKARILEVGEKWKNAAKGNQDFSGAYAEKFR